MKTLMALTVGLMLAMSLATRAAVSDSSPPAKSYAYYYGSARILDLKSGANSTEEILLMRVVDPPNNHLIEVACLRDPGQPTKLSPVYMLINGNTLTLSDQPDYGQSGKLTGTGQLSGAPWLWSYLRFSIRYSFSSQPGSFVQIDDVNYLVSNLLVARKQVYQADGSPLELWDAELSSIALKDFNSQVLAMGCPVFPNL